MKIENTAANTWQLRNGGGVAFLSSFLSSAFGS
jgi:hypothetical protein